jgi:predicted 2-oxoglutarate/Fe(II)-dependent dioxygenase YbiX
MTSTEFGEKSFYRDDIVSYKEFMSEEECAKIVAYFEDESQPWTMSAFFESYGMSLMPEDPLLEQYGLPRDHLKKLADRLQAVVEDAHERPLKPVSSHAQKWQAGAFAPFHSDNTDMEGNPSAWEKSKLVCLLYINDDYDGGDLDFRDHDLTIAPKVGELITFPGGINNVHQVTVVKNGTRHTIGAFWDYLESEYSEERMAEWEAEIQEVRADQKVQQDEWKEQLVKGEHPLENGGNLGGY